MDVQLLRRKQLAGNTAVRALPANSKTGTVLTLVIMVIAGAIIIAALMWRSSGGQWFVVETPSMGQAAPVGTLVLTQPAKVANFSTGEIITFQPPLSTVHEIYTHRVNAIKNGQISTKGDNNSIADPWLLSDKDIVGKSVVIIPGLGWLLRSIPYLIIGFLLVWFITKWFIPLKWRSAWRITGFALVASITSIILKPFIGLAVLATTVEGKIAHAIIVSTGMLPVKAETFNGASINLVSGQLGQLSVPSLATKHYYTITTSLNLDFWGWVIFWAVCLIPAIYILVVGLPPVDELKSNTKSLDPQTS